MIVLSLFLYPGYVIYIQIKQKQEKKTKAQIYQGISVYSTFTSYYLERIMRKNLIKILFVLQFHCIKYMITQTRKKSRLGQGGFQSC